MATKQRRSPFVWPTWITGILSTDDSCRWAPWFKAQHTYDKRPDPNAFDLAQWKVDHAALCDARVQELRAHGWTVEVEAQNKFVLEGRACTLSGQPDIVAIRALDVLIIDGKTGARKAKDLWQVMIYMLAVPMAREFIASARVTGEVLYPDGRVEITAAQFDNEKRARILAMLAEVGSPTPPARVPSARECAFCDIAACPDRVEAAAPVAVEAF